MLAGCLLKAGKASEALDATEKALKESPNDFDAAHAKLECLIELKRFPAAAELLKKIKAEHPDKDVSSIENELKSASKQ